MSFGKKREMRLPDHFQTIVLFESFDMFPLGLFSLWGSGQLCLQYTWTFSALITGKHGSCDLSLVKENIRQKIK